MPSGKQVLLHLLQKFSLARQAPSALAEVSDDLRVAFLLHGSTPDPMWYNVERVEWFSKPDDEGAPENQGLAVRGKGIFLSEVFKYLADEDLPASVAQRFPELTQDEYASCRELIFLLLTACEWHRYFESVETPPTINESEQRELMDSYRRKLSLFRKHCAAYLSGDYLDDEEST